MVDGVGAARKPREDPAMLRGEAKYTADLAPAAALHMELLRSAHGHATIRRVDTSVAAKMPGVVRVITAEDTDGKLMPLPCVWVPGGVESHFPPHPYGLPGGGSALATGKVRYVGEPVAAVVAETRAQAADAVRAIEVEYGTLPAVITPQQALADGAPQLHEAVPKNLNARWTCGGHLSRPRSASSSTSSKALSATSAPSAN